MDTLTDLPLTRKMLKAYGPLVKDAPITGADVVATILSTDYSDSLTQALNDDEDHHKPVGPNHLHNLTGRRGTRRGSITKLKGLCTVQAV